MKLIIERDIYGIHVYRESERQHRRIEKHRNKSMVLVSASRIDWDCNITKWLKVAEYIILNLNNRKPFA